MNLSQYEISNRNAIFDYGTLTITLIIIILLLYLDGCHSEMYFLLCSVYKLCFKYQVAKFLITYSQILKTLHVFKENSVRCEVSWTEMDLIHSRIFFVL